MPDEQQGTESKDEEPYGNVSENGEQTDDDSAE